MAQVDDTANDSLQGQGHLEDAGTDVRDLLRSEIAREQETVDPAKGPGTQNAGEGGGSGVGPYDPTGDT